MSVNADINGLNRLVKRISKLEQPDVTPLMATWMEIIKKDHVDGVLKGLDKDGVPMAPVKYRPVRKVQKPTLTQKNTSDIRKRSGVFGGFGPMASGINNNLSRREYEAMDGPPLAPRRQFSRVITNFITGYVDPRPSGARWEVYSGWREVVSTKGVQFLSFHFDGKGRLPKRDLRGLRPDGRAKVKAVVMNFFRLLIRDLPAGSFRD